MGGSTFPVRSLPRCPPFRRRCDGTNPTAAAARRHDGLIRRCGFLTSLVAALLLAACAEPPHKEMDQAQGAIDAARAAGAERYAEAEFAAAVTALELAHTAVADGDYRLALNHALDSRERAQNSAAEAAETRARIRGAAERSMAEILALREQAHARFAAADARTPKPPLADQQKALAQIDAELQKAGEAMEADDYLGAQPMLDGMKVRIEAVMEEIDTAVSAQNARRRR